LEEQAIRNKELKMANNEFLQYLLPILLSLSEEDRHLKIEQHFPINSYRIIKHLDAAKLLNEDDGN